VKNVDFLPPELLRQNEVRILRWWWLGVCVAFALFIGLTTAFQYSRKQKVLAELARLEPLIREAKSNEQLLAAHQKALNRENQFANLFAFVDHDWPRSQVLSELLGPFPDAMQLQELTLQTVEQLAPRPATTVGVTQVLADETATAPQDPAAADLEQLRQFAEKTRIVLLLQGTTRDVTQLHQYVARLAGSPLLESAKLEALDAAQDRPAGELKFNIRIQVRAPYGVPGGPQKKAPQTLDPPPAQQVAATTRGTEAAP
jgi:hypothetical protein